MKQIIYKIVFVFFVLLLSCRPPLKFALDPSLSDDDVKQIKQAANTWNTLTVPSKKISIDPDGKYFINEVETTDLGFNGYFSRERREMQIDSDTGDVSVYAVALHEFGHALGLRHTNNGVMNPKKVTTEFSAEDMAECRRVKACK